MAWTKTNLLDEAKEAADAKNSSRWSSTTIARIADAVYNAEWKGILDANEMYRWSSRTPSVDSTGRILKADLSTASERLFRILAVCDTERPWTETGKPFLAPIANTATYGPDKYWQVAGNYVQLFPAVTTTGITVYVNHRPKKITDLADSDNIEFPDGYEYILALAIAAKMLAKGGAETRESRDLKAEAEELRGEMLAEVQRPSTMPLQFSFGDSRGHYAG